MPARDLAGVGVLVTRPAHQSQTLEALITEAGAAPVLWPVLEIAPPQAPAVAHVQLQRFASFDVVFFVSANAVRGALHMIGGAFPAGPRLAAVGEGTARALRELAGRRPDLCPPDRYESEALLALPELADLSGKRVLIVRGEGGRELLADGLRARGAQVEYAEVYRRVRPERAPAAAEAALDRGEVHVITATSAEGLRNLVAMAAERAQALVALPLIVVNERMVPVARELGFRHVRVARAASDEALLEALRRWRVGEKE